LDLLGPYAQWIQRLIRTCDGRPEGTFSQENVGEPVASDWAEWWPPYGVWITDARGRAFLAVRDVPWSQGEVTWLSSWWKLWLLTEQAASAVSAPRVFNPTLAWRNMRRWRPWQGKSRNSWIVMAAVASILVLPVRLTVRAPGELVPREPTVLRATVEGMAQKLYVEPNQKVNAGDLLAVLDSAAPSSRLQVAQQALATAEAELRQTFQQALNDARAKAQLAVAQGKVEEKRTEVSYLREQMRRTELRAPHEGVVLIDDPGAWAGRVVSAGEPLLRIARPGDQEIEAWVAPADAIDFPASSPMRLFLASRPASPVQGTLRTFGFEPSPRPDGGVAYRVRGKLDEPSSERLGARGTVHIDGQRVPLVYWVLRRPLAALRETTGW
jgi:biotin carboxyl carrier protein